MTDRQIKNIAPATSCVVYKNFKSRSRKTKNTRLLFKVIFNK